jgi:hypothetical protein
VPHHTSTHTAAPCSTHCECSGVGNPDPHDFVKKLEADAAKQGRHIHPRFLRAEHDPEVCVTISVVFKRSCTPTHPATICLVPPHVCNMGRKLCEGARAAGLVRVQSGCVRGCARAVSLRVKIGLPISMAVSALANHPSLTHPHVDPCGRCNLRWARGQHGYSRRVGGQGL